MADQRENVFEPPARNKKCAVRAFGGARLTLMRGVFAIARTSQEKATPTDERGSREGPNAKKEGLLT